MTATTRKALPLPRFFDARNAERHGYAPDSQRLFAEAAQWRKAQRIAPAASDKRNVHLLLIDVQKDFCFPEGTLYVGGRSGKGAIEDSKRMAEFVYRNLDVLTNITTTLDTHFAFQIFFPSFWVDKDDQPLGPYREIVTEQIERGEVKPNPAVAAWLCGGNYPWLLKQVRHYCAELEKAGKYKLYLWPPHCLLGSDGHALVGVIQEARLFHSFVRGAQSWVEVKGGNALTENYSVMRPEVLTRHDGAPLAQRNTAFLKTLLTADAVLIAGQAASHCVKSSIDDLLEEIVAQDATLARKVYILADCMSAVAVPDGKGGFVADFTTQAEAALARFAAAGMHVVRSTEAIETWPEMRLG
ncbi:MAG: cysteine hydrolase family protein [Deltaproteobacteria bacterium]|nr:cysteine hydrolase family protein [Deltaproteobacteria bacterium]